MQKLIKYLFYSITTFILLLAIIVTAAIIFIDPNHYKAEINNFFYHQTGRNLSIDGKIDWTIFPQLGIQVHQAKLSNTKKQPFIEAKEMGFQVKLMPFLYYLSHRTTADNVSIKIDIADGVVHGIDVNHWLTLGSKLFHRESIPALPNTQETHFEKLTGIFNINHGIAHNNDLLLTASFMQVKGQGTINFVNEQIHYQLNAVKVNPENGHPHEDVIPLLITGSFSKPSIRLDTTTLVKKQIDQQINNLKEKVGEKILNSLFH